MSISTYAELKAAVAAWIVRDDLSDYVGDFIRLAENVMDIRLRCRELKVSFDTNVGSGTSTIAIPSDYAELIQMAPTGTWDGSPAVVTAGYSPPLENLAFNLLRSQDTASADAPAYYAEVPDGDYWELWPVGQYRITTWYYRTVPKLSDSNTTNVLLTAYPLLYLSGAMIEAENFLKVPANERGPWGQQFAQMIEALNMQTRKSVASGSTLRVKPAYGNI